MSEIDTGASHDVTVNGVKLHYVTWGSPSQADRTIIAIHGITANSQAFLALGPALAAQGWHVIAPDLRGRGLSDKPAHGYGVPFHANDLLSLCDALGLGVTHLVGHSLGAYIAVYMAALYPSRIVKIALVDGGGKIPEDAYETIAKSTKRLGVVYPSLEDFLQGQRSQSIYQWNDLWERYYRYDVEEVPGGGVRSRVSPATMVEEAATNAALRMDALTEAVKVPALIARATVGTLGPDRGFILPLPEAERMQRVMPHSRYVEIPGANHYTIVHSADLAREIHAFLGGRQAGI
ncbi:MAG TPA: alpha/beta hydrolase [Ktedonobacterales bacterium]|nr:alpha/beta hydrolase [Ktedonobacterales bacterium]